MSVFLLLFSIGCATARNLLSKRVSGVNFGTKAFFRMQGILFLAGGAVAVVFGGYRAASRQTLWLSLAYGVLLLVAQWGYTAALKAGKIAVCSTVYSLGFVFPTLSGSLLWGEPLSVCDGLGILMAIPAVWLSGRGRGRSAEQKTESRAFFVPLLLAMAASGGLGILQKLQQKAAGVAESASFVAGAFVFAGMASLVCSLAGKRTEETDSRKTALAAGGIGVAFGCSNLCNTLLAGLLDSALLFPVLNIGCVLFSILAGWLFFQRTADEKGRGGVVVGAFVGFADTFRINNCEGEKREIGRLGLCRLPRQNSKQPGWKSGLFVLFEEEKTLFSAVFSKNLIFLRFISCKKAKTCVQ